MKKIPFVGCVDYSVAFDFFFFVCVCLLLFVISSKVNNACLRVCPAHTEQPQCSFVDPNVVESIFQNTNGKEQIHLKEGRK